MNDVIGLLNKIRSFYLEHAPMHIKYGAYKKATEEEIVAFEARIADRLPHDYRIFLLNNDYEINFDMNFTSLCIEDVIRIWDGMCDHLEKGTFNDGRVEYHEKNGFGNWDGDYIKKVWWSAKWIPVSKDSCGNLKCLDLEPGINGIKNQILAMEIQDSQGPFIESYTSFTNYLDKHLFYLLNKKYTIDEFYDGSPMICVDSLIR